MAGKSDPIIFLMVNRKILKRRWTGWGCNALNFIDKMFTDCQKWAH
jgi:hypothetical protein